VSISSNGVFALIGDQFNAQIRHIEISTAAVTLLAGNPTRSSGSTDGVGTDSLFQWPTGVSISTDRVFALVVDQGNHLVRHIVLSTASVTTLAGNPATGLGFANGVGTNAVFSSPRGVSVSPDGLSALVADTNNQLIRHVVISTGAVTTLTG
jgi:DNA-binding beta-propeller fold protein YncE